MCLTSCSHDVVPKASFQKTFDRVYTLTNADLLPATVNPQEIALVFIIMAQGTMYNIEMPSHDPSAEYWLRLSERALIKGNFLSNNMVAGLQTLVSFSMLRSPVSPLTFFQHLMGHMHLCVQQHGSFDPY